MEYKGTARSGLYIMVFIILLNTCENNRILNHLEQKPIQQDTTSSETSIIETLNYIDSVARDKGLFP